MSSPSLRALAARALPLSERFTLFATHPEWFFDSPETDDILASWQASVSPDDPTAFDDYLKNGGIDRAAARSALGRLLLPPEAALPTWVEVVREVLGRPFEPLSRGGEIPFEEYWSPWVDVAVGRLEPSAHWHALSPSAQRALVRMLLVDLARSGTPSLMQEFNLFRFARLGGNDLFLRMIGVGAARSTYNSFVESITGDGAEAFLHRYPCVARLAAIRVELWVSTVLELLGRFEQDRAVISSMAGRHVELGSIVDFDTDLSDPHRGGRRVLLLRFDGARPVVYKPRSVQPELAYNRLLAWANETLRLLPLKTLTVLPRDGYGWMEFVEPMGCSDEAALERYFERCGVELAIVSVLRGMDIHHENMIACGEDPVLVDLEALFTPIRHGDERDPILRRIDDGVLMTGFLPALTRSPFGGVEDASSLGARDLGEVRPRFVQVNTDLMSVAPGPADRRASTNEPRVGDGPAARLQTHAGALVEGFQSAYRALLRARDALFAPGGPLEPFRGAVVRYIPRDTGVYLLFLRESRRPELMGDGRLRGVFLERLARAALFEPWLRAVVSAEIGAIEQEDVPHFTLRTDSTDLATDRETLRNAFAASGAAAVKQDAAWMSEDDLTAQVRLIDFSLCATTPIPRVIPGQSARRAATASETGSAASGDGEVFDPDRVRAAALEIAGRVRESAIVFGEAEHRVGIRIDPTTGAPQVGSLGPFLHAGQVGISVFLAAASKASGDDSLARSSLRSLETIRHAVRRDPSRFAQAMPLGAYEGIGGIIYGFVLVGRFIGEPRLLDEALALASAVTERDIRGDRVYDLLGGSAGLVMALAALYGATAEPGVRSSLVRAADHLVTNAVDQERGVGWPNGQKALAGMAHGNAGIAMALATAYELSGEARFWHATERALDYERSLRRDDLSNWADLREIAGEDPMTAWCHGAPGIALSRNRLLEVRPNGGALEDLEMALETTRNTTLRAGHLCCGMAGLDDILLEVGRRKGIASLVRQAERRAMTRVASVPGAPPVEPQIQRVAGFVSEGLMQGLAGVGYALLRLSDMAAFPCILDLSV